MNRGTRSQRNFRIESYNTKETELLEANLTVLREQNPPLADLIGRATVPDDCSVTADSDSPLLRVGGVLVHSARNPRREAKRIVDASLQEASTGSVLLFLGFGLGYTVEYGLSSDQQYHCVVYEPDIGLIKAAFLTRDLRNVLANQLFSLFAGTHAHELLPLLRTLRRDELAIIRNRALYQRNENAYRELERTVEHLQQRRQINHNTLVRFGRRWVRNLASNLQVVSEAAPVQRLENAYRGLPAVILAGGPSLDSLLSNLYEIAQRALVIAVDTSLTAALRAGVTPDYTVIVDPQYWNTRHLDEAQGADCEIISESSTHPRVFRLLDGPVSMCSSLFPLGKHIEDPSDPFGTLGAGGSVSTTAWDFARHLGCSPIYCAGLDLGFPGRTTHFHGSFFEARALHLSNRYAPSETMAFDYLHSGQTEYVKANDGGSVLSDRRMNIYRWWFETQARMHPDTGTRNLSAGGVAIPGIPFAPIHELLQRDTVRDLIDHIRTQLSPACRSNDLNRSRTVALRRRLQRLREELAKLEEIAEQAVRTTRAAQNQYANSGHVEPQLLEKLNEFDRRILENDYRDVAAFLLQETNDRVRKTADSTDSLSLSEEIYEKLAESCRYHNSVLHLDEPDG